MSKCPPHRPPNDQAHKLKVSLQNFCPTYEGQKKILKKFDRDHLEDALIDANLQRDEILHRANHETGAKELPGLVDAASFIGTPIKSPPELVRGILHQGSKLVLGGASNRWRPVSDK